MATTRKVKRASGMGWQASIRRKGFPNPCRQVARGRENPVRVRRLTNEERAAPLDACKASDRAGLYLLVILALYTGARPGELWWLTWSSIDLSRGLATLEDTKNKSASHSPRKELLVINLALY